MSASDPTCRPAPNLILLRASRLEALVPELLHLLREQTPENLLQPQTVIAAHPGMRQWLYGALARASGVQGIVANIEVLLPGSWIQRCAETLLPPQPADGSAWQRELLRWPILQALQQQPPLPGLSIPGLDEMEPDGTRPEPDGPDAAGQTGLQRLQLATHLAGLFSKYLIYRPDWLTAWAQGKDDCASAGQAPLAALEAGLFAPLWRHLLQHLGPQREQWVQALIQHLAAQPQLATPLHVFGFSHLAPAEQQLLHAWSLHAPVIFYLPDPCREYWCGLPAAAPAGAGVEARAALRRWQQAETERIAGAGESEWLDPEQNHPLLQRWGRLGQHFHAALAGWETLADIRHHRDQEHGPPRDALARLQESIRRLDIKLLRPPQPWPQRTPEEEEPAHAARVLPWWQALRSDASLRIHACHTRLRELEVLRDALLDAVGNGIAAERIVVMAPDIAAYAPLLPAVFGAPGDPHERRLPWYLADVAPLHGQPLIQTFLRLLQLEGSRLTLAEAVDLASQAEVAAAIGLAADAQDTLRAWLDASHAAWGLDAEHRQSLGLAPDPRHTLSWGLDRMLAGYVFGSDGSGEASEARAFTLPDGCTLLPLAGVHGPEAEALGAFERLLRELQHWRSLSRISAPASAWARLLRQRLDALLRPLPGDADAQAAHAALHQVIAQLAAEPDSLGLDPPLDFPMVQHLLLERLQRLPERQRFLNGGITFCGMVPQRAIPFDMICVLGLDDKAFPRPAADGGLDLMARRRRFGDRDVRSDDRWLFLETLMSARQRLHLSWQGQSAHDGKPRNPAAPLAELLSELDHGAGLEPGQAHPQARPWLIRHPLQPFDARYFDAADPALFSHSQTLAALPARPAQTRPDFLAGAATGSTALPPRLSLSALVRFWKRPAQDLLHYRLQLDLGALADAGLRESEPLAPRLERIESVARRVFFSTALAQGHDASGQPRWQDKPIPDWIAHGGLLPPGELGQQAWVKEAASVQALLQAVAGRIDPQRRLHPLIDLQLWPQPDTAVRLSGPIEQVYVSPANESWQILQAFPVKDGQLKAAQALDLGERLDAFLHWAALRLHSAEQYPQAPPPVRLCLLTAEPAPLQEALARWDADWLQQDAAGREAGLALLRQRLCALITLWHAAAAAPPLYFPATSQAALDAHQQNTPPGPAAHQRFDNSHAGERHYAPGWTALLARDLGFEPRLHARAQADTERLLAYACQLEDLMQLPEPPQQAAP